MSRWSYFARRVLLMIPIVFFGTTITFVILRMGPIDPAAAVIGASGDTEAYQSVRRSLGLDQPLWLQYVDYLGDLFTLQFGYSWVVNRGRPVWELIGVYAPELSGSGSGR
ncbi:nickel transporter permease NikB [Halolamina pelagica]|uniref:Nickel transporter permease NikB n=1 Tax=Halolamina pelagica TaxID=699431 RepID=A0A0P7H0G1_9EURY|nr:nickel transporter permease NikB [Halolamina pelagica]